MTETSILPGAAPSTDAGFDSTPPGVDVEESEGGDRRRLLIIGGVVGAVVLAAAAFMFLHKGSSSDSSNTFVPHSTSAAPNKPAPASGSKAHHPGGQAPSKVATLPKKAKKSNVRDPFKPLVVPPVATTGTAVSTTTVTAPSTAPSADTTGTDTGTGTTTPVTPPSTPPTTKTTGHGTTSGSPLWIQLMGVKGDQATFRVGYAHHKFRKFVVQAPAAGTQHGTVFDKVFALIGIQSGEVTVQIGDDTPFDLRTNVSHVV